MRSVVPVSFRPTKPEALYLGVLAVLAVIIQVIMLPAQAGGPDMTTYVAIAKDEIFQSGFWTNPESFVGNFWAMAYPTFLAVVFRVAGEDLARVQFIQILMAATLVVVPWILARRLPRLVQYAAPLVLVLCPALWAMGTSIGYEVLLAWLLCFALALAWITYEWDTSIHPIATSVLAIVSGLLLGGALLTQTKALVVLPVLAYLLYRVSKRTALWGAIGLIAGLLPWMIRNVIVLGTPSPLTNNAGYNLWVGNNPDAVNGGSMLVAPTTPAGESMTTAALKFMVSQPERWVELIWSKAARLLEPVFIYPGHLPAGPARTLLHLYGAALGAIIVLGVLMFLGGRLMVGRRAVPAVSPLAAFVALWFLAHLPFIAEPRYLASIAPVTVTVAVAAWTWFIARIRKVSMAGPAAEAHAQVQALERQGMPVSLDLANPSWRAETIVADARCLEPSSTLSVPAQQCGLAAEDHSWPAYYVRTLTDVLLDGDSCLVFADGRVIAQSGSGTRAARDAAFVSGATFRIQANRPIEVSGPIAPLGDIHHHYHVMLETLPRILHARDYDPATTFVTSEDIADRYATVLESWEIQTRRYPPGTVLNVGSLILVDQPELFWPRRVDIDALRRAFRVNEQPQTSNRRIYVSRRNAARTLTNEDRLEAELEALGFRTVILEEFSIAEQVSLFGNAVDIIAPHGAGLSGIAFMANSSRAIELTSGEVFENCYRRVAAMRGITYECVLLHGSENTPQGDGTRALDMLRALTDERSEA